MSDQSATPSTDLRSPSGARYAVVASCWNGEIVDELVSGARRAFAAHGVPDDSVDVVRVPGAWELPLVAKRLAASGRYAAIVALGCVVRGETRHYEHIADECAHGLMRIALDTDVPVLNGVLAVEDEADAWARAGGAHGNKGADVALAAIEIAALLQEISG
ncbi:MAG TPA: 6,7-dimethyl-8-ribityllumazine synthase [Rhodanobacteraceae bacterium]|nr:6,7-dimethyl-8-ribityllumazine synthase [Rhodanobacteraceae bacterium]